MQAEDRHLGSVQKNETVLYKGPKRRITAGTPLTNLAPVKITRITQPDYYVRFSPPYPSLKETSTRGRDIVAL